MNIASELSSAGRRILRKPVSALGIVLTLTLGITVSVGMFSVLNGVVLGTLPYPAADRIVSVYAQNVEQNVSRSGLTPAEAVEALAGVPGFEQTAIYAWGALVFTGGDARRSISTVFVSPNYFSVFGVLPALGRTLREADFGELPSSVVLTHAGWMELAGGNPDVVGRTLPFDGGDLEVVGVLPASFSYPAGPRMYRPIPAAMLGAGNSSYLTSRYLYAVGRLTDSASTAVADQGLETRGAALRDAHGLQDQGWRLRHVSLLDELVGDVRTVLYGVFTLAVLVLVVACATAACLMSIRLERREAEFAVRRALGASNAHVSLDLAAELTLLAALGATGGVLLARLIIDVIRPLAAASLPRTDGIVVDGAALAFATVAAAGSILLAGGPPLLRALRTGPLASLRGRTSREVLGRGGPSLLPAVAVGISATALVAALSLAVSLARLGEVAVGFRTDDLSAFQVFQNSSQQTPAFVERALAEIRAVPGVRAAVAVSATPFYDVGGVAGDVTVPGRDASEPIRARVRSASPGYHAFMDVPLLRGRGISERDVADAPTVVVINETFARRAFGADDPLGQTLALAAFGRETRYEIVGVAADTVNAGLRAAPDPELVVSVFQMAFQGTTLLVDAAATPPGWTSTIEQAIQRSGSTRPVSRSFTLEGDLDDQLREPRFFAAATAWFAALALLLGSAGINAVIAAAQRRRTREIGLRLALGAAPQAVAALVLADAARMVAFGLVGGGLLAVPALVWLEDELFGIGRSTYWAFYGLTALVLIVAGLAAASWPAWRAARTAPMESLRCE